MQAESGKESRMGRNEGEAEQKVEKIRQSEEKGDGWGLVREEEEGRGRIGDGKHMVERGKRRRNEGVG